MAQWNEVTKKIKKSFTNKINLKIFLTQKKLKRCNEYYNDLEHCGLNGKTPNQFLKNYQLIYYN